MRSRLGPQELRRPRPPAAIAWEAHPEPYGHPYGAKRSPASVIPSGHPYGAEHSTAPSVRQSGETSQMSLLLAPSAKGWTTCSLRLSALISFITSPKGIPRTQILHIRWVQRPLRSYHALSTAHDSRYRHDVLLCKGLIGGFCGQYLCSARHKQNISTLQNIKMQDNESLREFVKRFGQAILQTPPFFESLVKKPPTTMDDLFRRANKYSCSKTTYEQATQQVLVVGQASRGGTDRNAKLPDRPRPSDRRQEGPGRSERPPLTLSPYHMRNFSYDPRHVRLQVPSLFGRKAHKGETLKAILRSDTGGPSDEEYDSKRKRQKLLRAASVRERINSIQPGITGGAPAHRWDNYFPTSRPHPDIASAPRRPHHVLEIGDFDVRRILIDPGSSAYLVQASVVSHMGHSLIGPTDKDPPAADSLQAIQILEEGTHLTNISSLLTPEETRNIQNALRQNHDVFAWAHSDMKGIDPSITSHKLNVLPTARPIRQRVRRFHPDRQELS
ncbi:hypothetical protein CK203_076902 [Vitis vinifera]|uniref:Retrotransposon gag domain-containing protein n=1 Tax=Vitis vinifera TaxID=29760 RepID=A0A438DZJ6_VITVI|nr:hypothetical protein CK203_076902 [Vitis vinifera]